MAINNKTITVIITTCKRFNNLDKILQAWKEEPVDEVWLIDGSGQFKPQTKGVVLFSMPRDFGTRMDYSLATLTDTDFIILADDDIVPKPGLTFDLYSNWEKVKGGIVGTIGRKFHGPNYRRDAVFYKASSVHEPVETDFVGVICFSERNLFGFDTKGMNNNCDDLWWQFKVHPEVKKHVIPTNKFTDLPESIDSSAMFNNSALAGIRQKFYEEYYHKLFEGRTK